MKTQISQSKFLFRSVTLLMALLAAFCNQAYINNNNLANNKDSVAASQHTNSEGKPLTPDEEKALQKVMDLPEVKEFLKDTMSTAMVDRTEGDYVFVQVFKMVIDDSIGGGGHTSTFNWYKVNVKTGEVSAEF